MSDLSDKLKTFFGLFPEVKDKADDVEATLLALGVSSKEVLTTEQRNNLPADAFLYTDAKGEHHLPYKHADGSIDLVHLRNAIARIPQMTGVSEAKKSELQAKARKLLAEHGGEPAMEKKEMDAENMSPEMKKKMQDAEEENKEGKNDNPAEEKKEDAAQKKELDLNALTMALEATAKETTSLKTLLEATVKETSELKATLATGFEAVAKGMEQRDATIKQLQESLAQESAKVKELAGEIPNAVRHAYVPSESMQNVFARIANGDLAPIAPIVKEVVTATSPAQQPANPLFSFINDANASIGLAKPNQALPQ